MNHFNGEMLRALRWDKGLSQEGLGEIFGVTNITVCNWERELKMPSFNTVVELALYFGVSVDTFVK